MNGVVERVPRLVAAIRPTRFVAEPHLVLVLDDVALDEFLARAADDSSLDGLVSTLSGCLYDDGERGLVARTILPDDGMTTTCPLLVCPDDCDLTCTVVVVEVERVGQHVSWKRFGRARYSGGGAAAAIVDLCWFTAFEGVTFELDEYLVFLGHCRALERPWWA